MIAARLLALAFLLASAGPPAGKVVQLVASDHHPAQQFGSAVAFDERYAYVGARNDQDLGNNSGALYVFDRETARQVAKIHPPDGMQAGFFGEAVLPWGGRVLVGCPYDDTEGPFTGSVYVLSVPSGELLHKLTGSKDKWGSFGHALASDGDLLVVGAPHDSEKKYGKGAAFVFDLTTFELLAKLVPSDGKMDEGFGTSVAIGEGKIVVGAPKRGGLKLKGRVSVFDSTTFEELYHLDLGLKEDLGFGRAVAISNGRILAGAPNWEPEGVGAVHVFRADTGELQGSLVPHPSGTPIGSDSFGSEIRAQGDLALVSAPFQNGADRRSGVAFLFHVPTGEQLARCAPPSSVYSAAHSLALDGGRAIIGAVYHEDAGGAWIVDLRK